MIENEQEYRTWCRNSELSDSTIGNYVSWLNTASERTGENISLQNMSSEDDIDRMITLLQQHPDMAEINTARSQNTKSAMRQYVAMAALQKPQSDNLEPKIKDKLLAAYASLKAQGNLPTEENLQASYSTFRGKFGPVHLSKLSGLELLQVMHGRGNNNSLVYWLEFKNDDEFPGRYFGRFSGGSAHMFGIFLRNADNQWIAGSPQNERVVSESDAVEIATSQRNQLLAGVALIESLPENADDGMYLDLQQNLKLEAPDIYSKGWAHKYWHLLFPTKLDDYHNVEWQRFNIIKLLQLPPSGDGLYVCAGRFVRAAKELGWHITHLSTVLNSIGIKEPTNYWLIGTKLGGDRSIWEDMQRDNYVAIGWGAIGSLDAIINDNRTRAQIKKDIADRLLADGHYTGKDKNGVRTRKAGEILDFVKKVKIGDLILAVGGGVIGIGRVSGDYYFENTPPVDAFHRRKVDWLSFHNWQLSEPEGIQTTVCAIKKEVNMLAVEKNIVQHPIDIPHLSQIEPKQPPVEVYPAYTIENMINEGVFLEIPEVEKIERRLQSKKSLILQGAPGVGKTFVAKKLAYVLMGEKADDRIVAVQFHPSYSYEDFVRGYRPTDEAGKFELIDGSFWTFCDKARNNPGKKHVMLIDEINRGNLSQIFGELFMLVEADKRGERVTPLYRHKNNPEEKFSIPPNIYLIGTMNIADRSLALVDYALRRRFAFVTLEPKFDSDAFYRWLENNGADDELILKITERMIGLNVRISEDRQLGAAYRVGHSFFCNKPSGGYSDAWFNEVIETEIIPLLEEYWHDNPEQLKKAIDQLA